MIATTAQRWWRGAGFIAKGVGLIAFFVAYLAWMFWIAAGWFVVGALWVDGMQTIAIIAAVAYVISVLDAAGRAR